MLWLFRAKFTGTNPDMLSTLQTWVPPLTVTTKSVAQTC